MVLNCHNDRVCAQRAIGISDMNSVAEGQRLGDGEKYLSRSAEFDYGTLTNFSFVAPGHCHTDAKGSSLREKLGQAGDDALFG